LATAAGPHGGFAPSAALLKALLLNGAEPLAGALCTDAHGEVPLSRGRRGPGTGFPGAHAYEGFGRLSLGSVLALGCCGGGNRSGGRGWSPRLRLEVPGLAVNFRAAPRTVEAAVAALETAEATAANGTVGVGAAAAEAAGAVEAASEAAGAGGGGEAWAFVEEPTVGHGETLDFCFTLAADESEGEGESEGGEDVPVQATLVWTVRTSDKRAGSGVWPCIPFFLNITGFWPLLTKQQHVSASRACVTS
jgi:hypothetical protein